jgi:iron complex outermembrane receptor protein
VAWNYEISFKSALFDKRLLLNTSLFYMDVQDYQEAVVYTGDGTVSYFGNAEKVTLQGFEVEAEALSWKGWLFMASLGLTDAVYDDYQFTETVSLEGNKVADTPEWEFTGIAQYTFPMGLYLRGEFYASGKKYLTP